jgi:hypothetical protein
MAGSLLIDYELSFGYTDHLAQEAAIDSHLRHFGLQYAGNGCFPGTGWRDISFHIPDHVNVDELLDHLRKPIGFALRASYDCGEDDVLSRPPVGCVALVRADGSVNLTRYWERDHLQARLMAGKLIRGAIHESIEKNLSSLIQCFAMERCSNVCHDPRLRCYAAAICELVSARHQHPDLRMLLLDEEAGKFKAFDIATVSEYEEYLADHFVPKS